MKLLRRRFLHDGFRCKTQALTSTIQNMVLHPENDASARFSLKKTEKSSFLMRTNAL